VTPAPADDPDEEDEHDGHDGAAHHVGEHEHRLAEPPEQKQVGEARAAEDEALGMTPRGEREDAQPLQQAEREHGHGEAGHERARGRLVPGGGAAEKPAQEGCEQDKKARARDQRAGINPEITERRGGGLLQARTLDVEKEQKRLRPPEQRAAEQTRRLVAVEKDRVEIAEIVGGADKAGQRDNAVGAGEKKNRQDDAEGRGEMPPEIAVAEGAPRLAPIALDLAPGAGPGRG
jgi:hypothetical protein